MYNLKAILKLFGSKIIPYLIVIAITELILFLYNLKVMILVDTFHTLITTFLIVAIVQTAINIHHLWNINQIRNYHRDDRLPISNQQLIIAYQKLLQRSFQTQQNQIDKMQNQMNDSRNNFVLWAHNIKTPLFALQLLLNDEPESKTTNDAKKQLMEIQQNLNSMLYFIGLNNGNNDLIFKSVSLKLIIIKILKRNAWSFVYKNQHLDLQAEFPTIISDAKWLEIMLEQIIINANKYTNDQGTIKIYTQDNYLIIADNGIGIAPGDMRRIFENGFVGHNGRSKNNSSGIGLYLVKQISHMLELPINVISNQDGTKFIMKIK